MADPTVEAIMNFSPTTDPNSMDSMTSQTVAQQYEGQKKGFVGRNIDSFKNRFRDAEKSITQLASMGFEGVGAIPEGSTAKLTESIRQEREEYEASPNSRGGLLGEVMADIVMTLPILAYSAPTRLARVGQGMATGAQLGATTPVYSQDDINFLNSERLKNVTYSSLAAGAGTYVADRVLPYATAAIQEKIIGAPLYMTRTRSLEGIQAQAAKEAVEAAKKFNTFVTPAEATRDAIAQGREARTFLFRGAKRSLANQLARRSEIVDNQIDDIVNGLIPENRAAFLATRNEIKEEVMNSPLVGTTLDEIIENSNFSKILNKVRSKATGGSNKAFLALEGGMPVRDGTISQIEAMRRAFGDMFRQGTTKYSTAALTAAQKDMLRIADAMNPKYKILRHMNQRLNFQDRVLGKLGKVKPDGSRSGTFYKEFLMTPEKRRAFMKDIDNLQDPKIKKTIKQNVTAIEPLLKALHESPLESVMGKSGRYLEAKASGVGGISGIAVNQGSNMVSGALDRRIVEFITSPSWYDDWVSKGAKTVQQKNGNLMTAFFDFISKVAPATAVGIQQQAMETNAALEQNRARQRQSQRPY